MVEPPAQLERIRRALVIVALAGLGILFYSTVHHFVVSLVWAVILALALWPLFRILRKRVPGPAAVAPLLMCGIITLVILIPLGLLGILVAGEAEALLNEVGALLMGQKGDLMGTLGRIPVLGDDLQEGLQRLRSGGDGTNALSVIVAENKDTLIGILTSAAGKVVHNAFKTLVCVFASYFLFRYGEVLTAQANAAAVRLGGSGLARLLPQIRTTVRAVVYGLVATAIAQGVVAALGFWVAGVSYPLLLGLLTFVFSFIPFGPPLIWIPAAVSLLSDGRPLAAVLLAAWGTLVISTMDNILRPVFIGQATRMPVFFVFLGVLGGVMSFGMVGLFVGPVTVAVVLALWREFLARREGAPAGSPVWAAPGEP
jgi:predicted PurR-regulated permease PerM